MDGLFLANLTSPPLLFFGLGLAAALLRSDLDLPSQVAKALSLYLLMAIGFKGGVALAESPLDVGVLFGLGAAVLLAVIVPFLAYFVARLRLGVADAAALAATYGSISAVTFVTCTSYLDAADVPWSGYLVASMALMESPAIIVGLFLYRRSGQSEGGSGGTAELLRESFLNGSVFLLMGSLLIGLITGPDGMEQISPLVTGIFTGVLCIFLLDMGLVAGYRLRGLGSTSDSGTAPRPSIQWMAAFALGMPLIHGVLSLLVAMLLGLPEGDALLLVILGASASYIAVPAAMRLALPEANVSVYLPMSLAITFPFNIAFGIPMYHQLVRWAQGLL